MAQKIYAAFSQETSFELPLVSSSFKFECYPNAAEVLKKCDDYVMKLYGIHDAEAREKFVEHRMALLSCFVIPRAEDDSRMLLACKFMLALFTFDDVLEHSGDARYSEDLVAKVVFEGDIPPREYPPQFVLMREVVLEFRKRMSPKIFARFKHHLCKYLDSAVEESSRFHQTSCVPDAAAYHMLRKESICAYLSAGIVGEFCMGIEVEDEDNECEEFKALVDAVTDNCIYANDLFSFRKEFYNKELFNWVFVLIDQGLTLQEAIYRMCQMLKETDARIAELQSKFIRRAEEKGSEDLMKFAITFPMVAAGHLRWCYSTARYHGCKNSLVTGEPFCGTWILHPGATIVESPVRISI